MSTKYPNIKNVSSTEPGSLRAYLAGLQASEVQTLAAVAIIALGLAGSEPEWDSETIEWVVGELQDAAMPLGFPTAVGSCDDTDALRFWAELVGNENTLEMLAEDEGENNE